MLHLHASTMQSGMETLPTAQLERSAECHARSKGLAAIAAVMRLSLLSFVVALPIAVLAIGVPIPAKADCSGQGACNIDVEQRIAPSWPS